MLRMHGQSTSPSAAAQLHVQVISRRMLCLMHHRPAHALPPDRICGRHAAGLWSLSLAAGRSTELYDTIHAPDLSRRFNADRRGLVTRAPALAAVPVLLHSLSGQVLDLPVRKKPERFAEDVLEVREQ